MNTDQATNAADRGSELSEGVGPAVKSALFDPACQRLREWALIGPVQRAEIESFAERLLATERERCAKLVKATDTDGNLAYIETTGDLPSA